MEEGKEGVRRRRRRSWMRGRTVKVLSDCKCDGGLSRHCEALFVNCAVNTRTIAFIVAASPQRGGRQ